MSNTNCYAKPVIGLYALLARMLCWTALSCTRHLDNRLNYGGEDNFVVLKNKRHVAKLSCDIFKVNYRAQAAAAWLMQHSVSFEKSI